MVVVGGGPYVGLRRKVLERGDRGGKGPAESWAIRVLGCGFLEFLPTDRDTKGMAREAIRNPVKILICTEPGSSGCLQRAWVARGGKSRGGGIERGEPVRSVDLGDGKQVSCVRGAKANNRCYPCKGSVGGVVPRVRL